jgi:hypothetical protein
MIASVVTVWQKKARFARCAFFSEDSKGVGVAQSELCLTDRLLNQERLLRFHAKSVCSTKRQ